jgi:hypothetical protein
VRTASLFLLALLLLDSAFGQSSSVSLKETLDWLQSKSHLITYIGADSLRQTIDARYNNTWTIALKEPCMLEISGSGSSSPKPKDDSRKPRAVRVSPLQHIEAPKNPSSIYIPLSSINPQKISTAVMAGPLYHGRGNVTLAATDGKEVIPWRGSDKHVNVRSVTIGFSQEGLTERVSNALKHAVALCGGKADKKESF